MAKMIDESINFQERTVQETDMVQMITRYSSGIDKILEIVSVANRTGLLDLLESIMIHRDDILQILTEEVNSGKNNRFIRNSLSLYSLLSGIDPEIVRPMIENTARTLSNMESFKNAQQGGLSKILSDFRDPDVLAGMRMLLSILKGMIGGAGKV
ncbi:MAG: DUF1641 domain-containing protein [Thermoplasmata archaeon]